jgi:hypothetical protein
MIKRAPLKKDPPDKCSRWHVIVYNKETKKYDWHTVRGTRDDAKTFERKFESAQMKSCRRSGLATSAISSAPI